MCSTLFTCMYMVMKMVKVQRTQLLFLSFSSSVCSSFLACYYFLLLFFALHHIHCSLSPFTGIRQTVHDATVDLCAHMGQPPPAEVPEEQGVLEMLFEALSKHLSVIETMAAMWGEWVGGRRWEGGWEGVGRWVGEEGDRVGGTEMGQKCREMMKT